MKSDNRLLLFVFMFALMLGVSCSDLKQPASTKQQPELDVHPAGWVAPSSSNFHGVFIRTHDWNLSNCQQCHGNDYDGGIVGVSCLSCHSQPQGPEACNTCHGDFGGDATNMLTWAPPKDLDGNTAPTAPGVGAHTIHLSGGDFASGFDCSTCHVVPGSFAADGHIEPEANDEAEVIFHALALIDDAQPDYDHNTQTCSNTYCHGNWSLAKSASNNNFVYTADAIEGNNATPVWTDPQSAPCGSCHDLPPVGHTPFDLSACSGCHSSVVDNNGNIIDKTKHVNGQVNVFNQEYPIF